MSIRPRALVGDSLQGFLPCHTCGFPKLGAPSKRQADYNVHKGSVECIEIHGGGEGGGGRASKEARVLFVTGYRLGD